ncbi:sensor domain-containing diguanylate cyclase [Paenalkalicoccus suaedae]|uniref:Sensor domain-containing diguanylate cyclase n=1 Tax=Paenalkalicoccus suaedae TaxID=2592382 RepID=A0A859FGZ6_9BACI|nr:sensor domain-containing diguanylate cyclase [Paenalkalicoccus suaedae]QKS72399.1 sensor domain-containing diguanylate cyclase [Paenalkalicoccus suaedae]
MNRGESFIHERNQLVLLLLTGFHLAYFITTAITREWEMVYPLLTIPAYLVVGFLIANRFAVRPTMYLMIITYFTSFMFVIVQSHSILSIIFLWLGMLVSSLYHQKRVIIVASSLVTLLLTASLLVSPISISSQSALHVYMYLLLFTLSLFTFLLVQASNTNTMWLQYDQSKQQLSYLLDSAAIVTYSYDMELKQHDVTSGLNQFINFPNIEKSDSPILWRQFIHEEDKGFMRLIEKDVLKGLTRNVEFRLIVPGKPIMWMSAKYFPIIEKGKVRLSRLEGAMIDITERKLAEEKIEFLAFHDSLTKLPNRPSFYRYVKGRQQSKSFKAEHAFIVFIDLDSFKQINDRYGHITGDRLLEKTARRLEKKTGNSGMACRLGGDEFVLYLEKDEARSIEGIISDLHTSMTKPIHVDDHMFTLTLSIGVTQFSSRKETIDDLISQADQAMYEIKHDGKNGVKLFCNV